MGIPPRRLVGYSPAEVTTYEYDGGKLVKSTTVTPPYWDALSYALAAIFREWKASLCPSCGEVYATHLGKSYRDYVGAYQMCPAVEAVDRQHLKVTKADPKVDIDLDRGRSWFPMSLEDARIQADK